MNPLQQLIDEPMLGELWLQAARGVFLSFPDCTDGSKMNRKMQESLALP